MCDAPSPHGMAGDPNGAVQVGSRNESTSLPGQLRLTCEPGQESGVI